MSIAFSNVRSLSSNSFFCVSMSQMFEHTQLLRNQSLTSSMPSKLQSFARSLMSRKNFSYSSRVPLRRPRSWTTCTRGFLVPLMYASIRAMMTSASKASSGVTSRLSTQHSVESDRAWANAARLAFCLTASSCMFSRPDVAALTLCVTKMKDKTSQMS